MFLIVHYADNSAINISLWAHIQGFLRIVLFKCCCVYKSHGDLLKVDPDSVGLRSFLRFCISTVLSGNAGLGVITRRRSVRSKKGYTYL